MEAGTGQGSTCFITKLKLVKTKSGKKVLAIANKPFSTNDLAQFLI